MILTVQKFRKLSFFLEVETKVQSGDQNGYRGTEKSLAQVQSQAWKSTL